MLLSVNFLDTLVILFIYMFIYNLSLFVIFWTIQQFINFKFKTLHSFSNLKFNFYFVFSISLALFSMAGVPPFLGFFSKLFILLILINTNFFIFYFFFFSLLFFGLYFYLQNIRFLHSTTFNSLNYSFQINLRSSVIYHYLTLLILFFLLIGFFLLDDFLLYFAWLFS